MERGNLKYMNKKIILISLAVLLILVWVGVTVGPRFFSSKITTPVTTETNSNKETATLPLVPPTTPAQILKMTEVTSVKVLAKNFTERYGSYSSDNNFANLESLKPLMTSEMAAYVNKIIADGYSSKDFFGVTTQAVNITVNQLDAETAVVAVNTVRQETKGTGRPEQRRHEIAVVGA